MKTADHSVIEKALQNEATPEEAREVVRWLATPQGQHWLSQQIDRDEKTLIEKNEQEHIDHDIPSDGMYKYIMQQIHRQKIRRWIFRAAAVLIPLILITTVFFQINRQVDLFAGTIYDEVYVPKGEQMQFLFQDGSKVILNSESRIRYPRKFGLSERKIQLEGEGWFDVAENKKRPFIIDLKNIHIRVLGTTFNVKAYPEEENISVALETGNIELSGRYLQAFVMAPGEQAVYSRRSGRCDIFKHQNIALSSAWKQDTLVFSNTPLSEVILTLSRRYDIEFEIEDSISLKYSYTLKTDNRDLDSVLKELEKITPVRFEREDRSIKIRLKK